MGGSVYEPITHQNLRENKLLTKFLVFSASLFDMKYEKLHFPYIYYFTKVEIDQTYDFIIQLNKSLKFDASLIPLLIILLVISKKKEKITIKILMTELPFSEMGIRYHLRKLLFKKILKLKKDPNDARKKNLLPTEKLYEILKLIEIKQ